MIAILSAAAVFACNLKALTAQERIHHTENSRQLRAAVVETQERPAGLRFRLDGPALTTIADWVQLERRCCPFFTFAIELEGDGGPTWLTLSGAPGVKEFIRLELDLH